MDNEDFLTDPNRRKCLKCGGELHFGYGLAGGGMGSYEICLNDGCDYFSKEQDNDF